MNVTLCWIYGAGARAPHAMHREQQRVVFVR